MNIKLRSTRKRFSGWMKRIGCGMLIGTLLCSNAIPTWATSISKTEQEKKEAEEKLNSAKQKAEEAAKNKNAAQSKVNQLSTELKEILGVIQVLEGDIASKEADIAQAEKDYEAAKAQEEKQYSAMKKRIKYMYEKGDTEYLEILMQVESMADMLNKAEYVQELYTYDRHMLTVFQETKQEVANFQSQLEEDKIEMEELDTEYKEQQGNLEAMISKQKTQVNNFDSQLAQAKQDAAVYAKSVEEKTAQLKAARAEEARKKAEAEAAAKRKAEAEAKKKAAAKTTAKPKTSAPSNNTYTGPAASKSSGGTAQGRAVADYALQFVGNPYVYGGTSLTNGADCSGFTKSVYSHFGVSLPRTSSQQASAGSAVSFDNIQAGDLVCYAGHVALYIGNGQIVHASSAKTGIKTSSVTYRTILAIRRVL